MNKFANLFLVLFLLISFSAGYHLKKGKKVTHKHFLKNTAKVIAIPTTLEEAVNYKINDLVKEEYCSSDLELSRVMKKFYDALKTDVDDKAFQKNIDILNQVLKLMDNLKALVKNNTGNTNFVEVFHSKSLQMLGVKAQNKGMVDLKTKIDEIINQANKLLQLKVIQQDTLQGIENIISITNDLISSLNILDSSSAHYLEVLSANVDYLNNRFCL